MTSYIKSAISYIKPAPNSVTAKEKQEVLPSTPTPDDQQQRQINSDESGIIKKTAQGVYSAGAGVVGLGVSGVRWAAGATYNVGSGAVSILHRATKTPPKDKND